MIEVVSISFAVLVLIIAIVSAAYLPFRKNWINSVAEKMEDDDSFSYEAIIAFKKTARKRIFCWNESELTKGK